ncbi:MAG: SPFH domain-containing protein [Planctomycetota bacterium]
MTQRNVLRIAVGLFIAAVLLMVMFSYQVRHNEKAVVATLGHLADDPVGPGLHWRWPWPIQSVTKYDCRLQRFSTPYEQFQTADQRTVLVGLSVHWRIDDPVQFRTALGDDLQWGERAVSDLVRNAQGNVVGSTDMDSFASLDASEQALEEMEEEIQNQVVGDAMARYGINVRRVGIERTGLPQNVTEAVMANERQKRQRDAENARSQGRARAEAIVSDAESTRDQILAFARQRATQIRAEGQAVAAEYYQQYGDENEDFAMFLRRLEYLRTALGAQTLFVLDGSQYDLAHGWFNTPPAPETIERPAATQPQVAQ